MTVYVLNRFKENPYSGIVVDTTSRGNNKDLSPFYLGPVSTYEPGIMAANMENLWQYSKVYQEHAYMQKTPFDLLSPMAWEPADSYYTWRNDGWTRSRAVRYPMGKGAKPLYSLWKGTKLDYINSRKVIYAPFYASAVLKTRSYTMLYNYVKSGQNVILTDFDGYDYIGMGVGLKDVINNPKKTMGHAFVIAMLLTGVIDECLK